MKIYENLSEFWMDLQHHPATSWKCQGKCRIPKSPFFCETAVRSLQTRGKLRVGHRALHGVGAAQPLEAGHHGAGRARQARTVHGVEAEVLGISW